jgi:hypothetical protein
MNQTGRCKRYSEVVVKAGQRPALGPQNCGLCRQVVVVRRLRYLIKIEICSFKLGSLYTGGRYSEVAVRSGLTVFTLVSYFLGVNKV